MLTKFVLHLLPGDELNHENTMLTRRSLFGLNFISAENVSVVTDEIMQYAYDPRSASLPLVITPNVDDVVQFNKPQYRPIAEQMQRASFILPDGQFVVWASRLLDRPLQSRLPGSDLFPVLWRTARRAGKKILMIAPGVEVAEAMQAEYPGLHVYVPPMFHEADTIRYKAILETAISKLDSCQPDMVLIGIRFPKQHMLALDMIRHLQIKAQQSITEVPMPLFMLLGASFEFYLGIKKRAPKFLQRIGLEWFHRFAQEPRRLFKRFFIEDLAFFPMVWKEVRGASAKGQHSRAK